MRIATVALLLLITVAMLSSSACKKQETQPTSVELKLFTVGELPPGIKISALDVTVALGSSVSLASANSSTPSANAVTASDNVEGSMLEFLYSAPTDTVGGTVRIGLISVTGFGTGEFATIKGAIVGGDTPSVADLGVISFAASEANGQVITGLTAGLTVDLF